VTTDNDAIVEVLLGQKEFFEVLVERYMPFMRCLCVCYVPDLDAHGPLLEDAFLRCFLGLDTFGEEEPVGDWLMYTTRELCIKKTRGQTLDAVAVQDRANQNPPPSSDPWIRAKISSIPVPLRERILFEKLFPDSDGKAGVLSALPSNPHVDGTGRGKEYLNDQTWAILRERLVSEESLAPLRKRVLHAILYTDPTWSEPPSRKAYSINAISTVVLLSTFLLLTAFAALRVRSDSVRFKEEPARVTEPDDRNLPPALPVRVAVQQEAERIAAKVAKTPPKPQTPQPSAPSNLPEGSPACRHEIGCVTRVVDGELVIFVDDIALYWLTDKMDTNPPFNGKSKWIYFNTDSTRGANYKIHVYQKYWFLFGMTKPGLYGEYIAWGYSAPGESSNTAVLSFPRSLLPGHIVKIWTAKRAVP
jgi:hypothetical protein